MISLALLLTGPMTGVSSMKDLASLQKFQDIVAYQFEFGGMILPLQVD